MVEKLPRENGEERKVEMAKNWINAARAVREE